MQIDWGLVKKQTLWNYEDLVKKLSGVLAYNFVGIFYNHTMEQARRYAELIGEGYLADQGDSTYIENILTNLDGLARIPVESYSALVQQVDTKDKCLAFLQKTGFGFEQLIETLNYLLRWVLPFRIPVRELLEVEQESQFQLLQVLKRHKLGSNLDVLEHLRGVENRREFSETAHVPETSLLELVHRADISRLAYVRGKTVRHLCGGGYDSLSKIASADLKSMEVDMEAYYRSIGKSLADFKSVIPLKWMIGGARILPVILEE